MGAAMEPGDGSTGWAIGDPAPAPLPLRSEAQITADWEGDEPVVSVLCSTYQHRDYIEDALRGFLGQRTTFPFEILVRDDASTDGTAEIVADFAGRYPAIVRAILEPENRWRERTSRLRSQARGAFIARCEGDDYWIDPLKLQTQVDGLQASPGTVMSHHQAVVIEEGRIVQADKLPPEYRRDLSQAELVRGAWALTLSLVFRNLDRPEHPYRSEILNADRLLLAQLGEHGGARWETDLLPAVYRRHPGGVWSTRDPVQRSIDAARSYYWIGHYFVDRDQDVADHYFARGLDWYLRGSAEVGADLSEVATGSGRLMRAALHLPPERMPKALRQVVEGRDAARTARDRLQRQRNTERARVQRLRERKAQLEARNARLQARLDAVTADRERRRDQYERLRQRLAVRMALWLAGLARPVFALRDRLLGRG